MAQQTLKSGEERHIVWLNEAGQDLTFRQEAHSKLHLYILHLPIASESLTVTDTLRVEQAGEECLTEIYALSALRNNDNVSLHTQIVHSIGGGISNQKIKFVLSDQSVGQFFGEMKIAPDAQHTEANQLNRNLLLSDNATMHTRPQLEIYADDVKAGHGASTGQLDASSLFYMQQRGLSAKQGRQMLLRAFMEEIADAIPDEEKRQQSIEAIDRVIEHLD